MPGGTGASVKLEKITAPAHSDLRQAEIQLNNLINDVAALQRGFVTDAFFGYYGVGPNNGTAPLAIGSTAQRVGTAAMTFAIGGVPVTKAVDDAGTAFGSLGTIPASTWGLIAIDVVAAGTVTYVSAAASYTTGYATEAAAIAAMPVRTTLKARAGYLTIHAPVATFVVGTDSLALAGSTVNYYPAGICTPTGLALNGNGVVSLATLGTGPNPAWSGGRNGVLGATIMAIGGVDVRVSTTAFIYNCAGLTNVPKAADTNGTAFGALGTIPADRWGLIAFLIDGAGTKTYISAPSSYTTGYASEQLAKNDLANMFPAANLCYYGYCTIKTKAATAFIVGTDSPAGGGTGNIASATNYYPVPGPNLGAGETAALIANREGVVLTSTNY